MMLCKNCFIPMVGVMSFSRDSNEGLRCREETKHQKIRSSDLNFGEILKKEIHKRK